MNRRLIIGLFLCVALAQVGVPLSMILRRELVLTQGAYFKFETAPVDPYDAFRGRYVALAIKEDNVPAITDARLSQGQRVFALIGLDGRGFAKLSSAVTARPRGKDYIQARVRYVSEGKLYLDLPIDRYYMEEGAAPMAETVYREHVSRDKQDAYAAVRVKDGFAVIAGLYVGGQKIEDAVKQKATPPKALYNKQQAP